MKIIIDSREKKDIFLFSSYEVETEVRKLDTGDYSIEGFESSITIDRKRTSSELWICLFTQYERFARELDRMASYDESYILCTFPYSYLAIFPKMSGVPRKIARKLSYSKNSILDKLNEAQEDYPHVTFLYGNNNQESEGMAHNILRNYYLANK